MHAPSVTKTFGASWTWLCAFSTDVFGSRPMRAVPISWMPMPGARRSSNVVTFLTPAASSISAACRLHHVLRIASSLAFDAAVERHRRQAPLVGVVPVEGHAFSWFGRHSPKPLSIIPSRPG